MNGIRQWDFVADMNGNGAVTISDVWLWIKWLYFWPGDAFIDIMMRNFSTVAAFFELSANKFGGPLSLFISFGLWIVAIVMFVLVWRLMDRIGARAAEALRRPFLKKQ